MTTITQTYASNSWIPTNTLASGSSTPTGNPNDTISDLFSSNGSPPLIVAFLAIGLFVVALIGVFGWRRLARSRGLYDQPITPNRRRRSISAIGKRPVFWDVWADPKDPEKSPINSATRWENITPMTTILTFLIPSIQPVAPVDPSPPDPNCHMHFRMLRSSLSAIRRFYFPEPPPPPPPPPVEKEVEPRVSHTSDEMEWEDASSLQVSVIVTMPRQRRCCSGSDMEWELGEFCVGTMDVPLSKGG